MFSNIKQSFTSNDGLIAPEYNELSKVIVKTEPTNENQVEMVERNGKYYDEAFREIQASDPSKWNKEMVDKAYFVAVYADKIGAISQTMSVIYSLERAKATGIDISNANITEADMETIKNRALELQTKGLDN